jgi:hypothetical protein
MKGSKSARVVSRKKTSHHGTAAQRAAKDREKARKDDLQARHHLTEASEASSRSKADSLAAAKDVVTGPFEHDTGKIRQAADRERSEALKESQRAAKERADARKDLGRARVERARARAALGGSCTWEAFEVPRRPWQRRSQCLSRVAKRAGFVEGPVSAGGVVGVWVEDGKLRGYHAAKVLLAGRSWLVIDLYGAPKHIPVTLVEEAWVRVR